MDKRTAIEDRYTINRRVERSRHGWILPDRDEMKPPETAKAAPSMVGYVTRQQRRLEARRRAKEAASSAKLAAKGGAV